MVKNKIGGWGLEDSMTDTENEHYITKYTNGKMWVKAESHRGTHSYSYGQEGKVIPK